MLYFVELAEALAIQNDLVAIGIKQADSNVFNDACVYEVLKDADIRRVGCFDLVVQGISTCSDPMSPVNTLVRLVTVPRSVAEERLLF